jgi:20S proteasome subunit beta 3
VNHIFVGSIILGIYKVMSKIYIRCIDLSSSFIVAGTATEQLYGMLEALYEPNLGPDELFETMSQAFLNAVDRDAISGWGVVTYVMYSLYSLSILTLSTKDQIIKRYLKGRMD